MPKHKWTFKARFRANIYGWKASALATKRLKEAVSEIKKVAKSDPVTAGDGAVALMERIWPALQDIDGSSGSLGNAVYQTLLTIIPFVAEAPAEEKTRRKWLERLFEAIQEDGVDYLAPVGDRWGKLCAGDHGLANEWTDRLLPLVERVWSSEKIGVWVKGATICLSCLVATERYEELRRLLSLHSHRFWHFDQFWAHALVWQGRIDEALEFAESCRNERTNYDDSAITTFCEQLLLDAGRSDEAYERYALEATRATTNLAIFRKIAKKYSNRSQREILLDLMEAYPPIGKWFATAKTAGCLDVARECAADLSADPNTLLRAARDFVDTNSEFATHVALCVIKNLLAGGGYEPSNLDILHAYRYLIAAAAKCDRLSWASVELDRLIGQGAVSGRKEMLQTLVEQRGRHSPSN